MASYKIPGGPTEATQKLLYAYAGRWCAFPGCSNSIVADATTEDGPKNIGKIAHIHARSSEGPRPYPGRPTAEIIHHFDNLILLCAHHHELVDVQPNTFTVEDLRSWKSAQIGKSLSQYKSVLPLLPAGRLTRDFQFVAVDATVQVVCPAEHREEIVHTSSGQKAVVKNKYQEYFARLDDGTQFSFEVVNCSQIGIAEQRLTLLGVLAPSYSDTLVIGWIYNQSISKWHRTLTIDGAINRPIKKVEATWFALSVLPIAALFLTHLMNNKFLECIAFFSPVVVISAIYTHRYWVAMFLWRRFDKLKATIKFE